MIDRDLLVGSVADLFSRNCPLVGRHMMLEDNQHAALWALVEGVGLTDIGVQQGYDGAGGSVADMCAVLRTASRFAPPIPLAETQLARWLAGTASLYADRGQITIGPTTFTPLPTIAAGSNVFDEGLLPRVPFVYAADRLVVLALRDGKHQVAIVPLAATGIAARLSLTGEAMGRIDLRGVRADAVATTNVSLQDVLARGALVRAQQIAGALWAVMNLAISHACERRQFGRPISQFQVIQHYLAEIAGEVAAADMVAQSAAELGEGDGWIEAAAIAKVRTGRAARAAAIAHQVHGAVGVTEEHPLQLLTRRIWSWCDDFGSEIEWAKWLGRVRIGAGGDDLWPAVAKTP